MLRPSDTHYTQGSSTLYQTQPTYDPLGDVTGVTSTLPQGVDTQVFCYDSQDRLTWAGSSGAPPCSSTLTPGDTGSLSGSGASYSASYAYDAANRLSSSPLGSYTYGDAAHVDAATQIGSPSCHLCGVVTTPGLLTRQSRQSSQASQSSQANLTPASGGPVWAASYDAAGNMTCRAPSSATTCSGTPTGNVLAYDNEGRLTSWQNTPSSPTSTDSFLYDGEGNRVQQVTTVSGTATSTVYVGGVEELATTGATTTTTAYYGGLALSVNGTLSYTLSDGLGSVSAAVSTSGAVTASQLYGPYGGVRYQSGSLPTSKGYTGQRADAVTGLDYYGARYYDPVAGQFTSADTTFLGGLNLYAYVGGNPQTLVDPTGHDDEPPDLRDAGKGPTSNQGGNLGGGSQNGPDLQPNPLDTIPTNTSASTTEEGGLARYSGMTAQDATTSGDTNRETASTTHGEEVQATQDAARSGGNGGDSGASGGNGGSESSGGSGDGAAPPGAEDGGGNGLTSTNPGSGSPPVPISPSSIRYSQSSVNGAPEIITSMQTSGWVGDPIDVVQMPDGGLTTIDNTRVVAANEAGIDVQAEIHPFDEPLPEEQVGRFTTRRGGAPSTWGEAVMNRIGSQNAKFRNAYPFGAPSTNWEE